MKLVTYDKGDGMPRPGAFVNDDTAIVDLAAATDGKIASIQGLIAGGDDAFALAQDAVSKGSADVQTAIDNGVDGILANCGGGMACATCHGFFDDATFAKIGPPAAGESDMLDFAAVDREPTSRLCCQVIVSDEIEGAEITLPERQT